MYIDSFRYNGGTKKSSYLNSLAIVKHLQKTGGMEFEKPVTFLVGENGTGKSTLVEAIAVAYGFNAEGGSRNFSFSTNDTHSELYKHITLSRTNYAKDGFFLRAESLYNAASNIDELDELPCDLPRIIDYYGGVSLHEQSHGESFIAIMQNRLFGKGMYIFDEPEAALSPSRQMTMLCEMDRLVKKDSQFIIATHSPILLAFPKADIIEITSDGIKKVTYDECEHVNIYRHFLSSPERMIRYLLEK